MPAGLLVAFSVAWESIRDIVFRVIFGERGQCAIGGKVGEHSVCLFLRLAEPQQAAAVFLVVLQHPDAGFRLHQLCAVSGVELNHGGGLSVCCFAGMPGGRDVTHQLCGTDAEEQRPAEQEKNQAAATAAAPAFVVCVLAH